MLSSSKAGDGAYLATAIEHIDTHLGDVKEILFIPFAGVSIDWDSYTQMVQTALPHLKVTGIHQCENPKQALNEASAIAVGGGNTFHLLNELYKQDMLNLIQDRVTKGVPYIGWSAGSNICGNSIRTTNDMPIVEPPSFSALALVPFQLNPHYTDYQPPGHHGETRDQRLDEFCRINPQMPVIAIREGTALLRNGDRLTLKGKLPGKVFLADRVTIIEPEQDLSGYL